MLDLSNIQVESLIPQRYPFVMVSTIIDHNETLTTSAFQISPDNYLCEQGKFSPYGLIENMAQTAACHSGLERMMKQLEPQIGFIGACKNISILKLPNANDYIVTTVFLQNKVMNALILNGKVSKNGLTIAICEFNIFLQEKTENE